jgi:small subunit ribosomal protein S8e
LTSAERRSRRYCPIHIAQGEEKTQAAEAKKSKSVQRKLDARLKERVIDVLVAEQFNNQKLLVRLTSRPGQSGRADGYVLEGKELEFYVKKIESKKK